ncbi:TonB family protein [Pedobacter sp. MC2016-14]|uniref:energy transducer TonB n=1 Tax=Pedobacter sp. MC2016-14 TaxID=2897327 RepID=UPI001E5EFFFB|nr:energy transducer TonB [Pedobacter sp. MC2016-14]MCD0488532.1 TonB family protein [Pedobacter sp. MC2016-14]
MLDSKIDLHRKEWLDVVFNQKNKSYGAYQLRQESSGNTTKALFFTSVVFVLLFVSPKIIAMIKGPEPIETFKDPTVIEIAPPPAVDPIAPPPLPVSPPAPKENQIKFPPPIVVEDAKVTDDVAPDVKDLKDANPGLKTIAGVDDGEIVITGATGISHNAAAATGTSDNLVPFEALETQPDFPGGMQKFYAYLQKTVRYPAAAQEIGLQGKVFLSFIIEKNGELTDIKVDRKLGGGTDEEAMRVLKSSPRWIPGIQNGRPVRVKYNIPISFNLAQ